MVPRIQERVASTLVSIWRKSGGDCGQGIAEYVIILAVIVVAGIMLATAFSGQLTSVWNSVTTQFSTLA